MVLGKATVSLAPEMTRVLALILRYEGMDTPSHGASGTAVLMLLPRSAAASRVPPPPMEKPMMPSLVVSTLLRIAEPMREFSDFSLSIPPLWAVAQPGGKPRLLVGVMVMTM